MHEAAGDDIRSTVSCSARTVRRIVMAAYLDVEVDRGVVFDAIER